MLKKFAKAVERMQNVDLGQSASWRYQWYIHAIPSRVNNAPATKASELNRAFGLSPSLGKALAFDTWNTCQAHRAGSDDRMFLGWHRLYLMAFEDVVRGVLNDEDFSLPYWDYATDASLPEAFRSPEGPTASLYRANRTRTSTLDINAGDPMDKDTTESPFNLNDMRHEDYATFSSELDDNLHAAVHVGVGNPSNMGAVPTAAGDPIFWLHHCNIDRIWAGWNAAGGKNPSTSREFVFADRHNKRWARDVSHVNTLDGLYAYDVLPKVPGMQLTTSASGAGEPEVLATSKSGRTKLNVHSTRVTLTPVPGASLSTAAQSAPGQDIFVFIEGVDSITQPGTLYEAFLDLPDNADHDARRLHYLGTFNFFNTGKGEQRFRFNATDVVARLGTAGLLLEQPTVTIIPVHAPDQSAEPVVGTIRVEQR